MRANRSIQVFYKERLVGTLAFTANRKAAFSYAADWLESGFSISPFSLPLKRQVFVPEKEYFGGLFGVFADSLPDAWGNILLNRVLRKNHIPADSVTVLDRLAIVGNTGMGALSYHPEIVLTEEGSTNSLDYHSLMKLTKILTRDNKVDLENMFRRMCFNVFAHNRDDHSKNFSYIYDEKEGWRLSPAYDLTYSSTYFGEHTTTVDGNGANPGEKELLAVGRAAGMKKRECEIMIEEIRECVHGMLGKYIRVG